MKQIILKTVPDCMACEIVQSIIPLLVPTNISYQEEDDLIPTDGEVYPVVTFYNDRNKIATIHGSMPKDFYESVIQKFERL